jgi:hypothetical protein
LSPLTPQQVTTLLTLVAVTILSLSTRTIEFSVVMVLTLLSLGITTSTLKLNQVGADTAIVFNNQTLATLTGIQASSLSLTDSKQFVFDYNLILP